MSNTDRMYRVMYLSTAQRPFTEAELDALLHKARARNAERSVTGTLIYDAGHFAQVLEGPEQVLGTLMERITADPRHTDLIVLSAGPADERIFTGWAMDRARLDRMDDVSHSALRGYMREHHIADRETVAQALTLFIKAHGRRLQARTDPTAPPTSSAG